MSRTNKPRNYRWSWLRYNYKTKRYSYTRRGFGYRTRNRTFLKWARVNGNRIFRRKSKRAIEKALLNEAELSFREIVTIDKLLELGNEFGARVMVTRKPADFPMRAQERFDMWRVF